MPNIVVERPGLLTTIQDSGRWGYQSLGVPVSGPMDPDAAILANELLGNDEHAAVLEVTLLGPTLRFERDSRIAITGALFEVELEGRGLPTPLVADVAAGGRLRFGGRYGGCRAYIAVAGGLDTPVTLGSRSTHVRTGLGGQPLKRGDVLRLGSPTGRAGTPIAGLPGVALPGKSSCLRVLPGYGDDPWSRQVRASLCRDSYRVTPASDRMGYRLAGPAPWPDAAAGILSGPVVTGAIQIPPGGEPILLMADRQTTGGYAVAAVVCEADLGLAGQLAPGDAVCFREIELMDALAARAARRRQLDVWRRGRPGA